MGNGAKYVTIPYLALEGQQLTGLQSTAEARSQG
jgi:hypothetical protein